MRRSLLLALLLLPLQLFGQHPQHDDPPPSPPDGERPAVTNAPCVNGVAAGYPCRGVDLLAFVPKSALGAADGTLNSIWGWTDVATQREYALVGLSNGVAFVDITVPTAPVSSTWRDMKVYRDHMYVVADNAGFHGVQVFDLRQLRGATTPRTFTSLRSYYGPGVALTFGELITSAHNIAINEETGFAYVVGARTTCAGGLHFADLRDPARPRFAGCFAADGYTHDTQCVVYRGPDPDHQGREICFASNEDTVTIVDVTNKKSPRMISRSSYPAVGYTHQGWLTDEQRYFLVNDELDELKHELRTRTIILDVRDLDAPIVAGEYFGPTEAIDHNLFIRDGIVYEANYRSGVRLLDVSEVAAGTLREVAYFDIVPDEEEGFGGAWSVYPFFPSGNFIVSGIEQGLYVFRSTAGSSAASAPAKRRRGVNP